MRRFQNRVVRVGRLYTALPELTKPVNGPATLPPLDFDGVAQGCPPLFTARQIELHYTKHHQAYVDKLNAMLGNDVAKWQGKPIEELALQTDNAGLFNQAAQHFNHSFFWKCLFPGGKPMPKPLSDAITEAFGSVDKFKADFQAAAVGNFGSGWTWLVWDPKSSQLKIVNTSNAGFPLSDGHRPLFTVDVWEHAYYKDFENRRPDYVVQVWGCVNWDFVNSMLAKAKA